MVTVSNRQSHSKMRLGTLCPAIQGMSYGAALVGFQSAAIVIPSMASAAGAPVAAIATGVGVASTIIGFATMVAHDMVCP